MKATPFLDEMHRIFVEVPARYRAINDLNARRRAQPLALPAPTLERHLARTIDGRSLTGVPGEWNVNVKRRPFRQRRKRLTPYQLAWLHSNCTGEVICHNPPHPRTALWTVVSNFDCGAISLSHVWAHNKAAAIAAHRELQTDKETEGDEVNCLAVKIGGGQ